MELNKIGTIKNWINNSSSYKKILLQIQIRIFLRMETNPISKQI